MQNLSLPTAKRRAHFWLAAAFFVFLASLVLPQNWWQGALKACAEAALVGGLADWFAVSALFHHIPIPFISRETDILRRQQSRIAERLGQFVRQHFFDRQALQALMQERDLAAIAAQWLSDDAQRKQFSRHLQQALRGVVQSWDDAPIQGLLLQAVQQVFGHMDMRGALANLLDSLMRQGRHQQLLGDVISHLAAYLAQPKIHGHFAEVLAQWLQREYPKLQLLLPTEKLGQKGADVLSKLLQDFFTDMQNDPGHFVRQEIHAHLQRLQMDIPSSPIWQQRLMQFQADLAQNPALHTLVRGMAGDLRAWALADLQAEHSHIRQQLDLAGNWLAATLQADDKLRSSLNARLESAVLSLAPDIGAFLQTHISRTLGRWDSTQMVLQIEAQVGSQLQSIRVNGTVLGGVIGLLLWGIGQATQQWVHLH
jgi:uncharacterized membrane-anchored protein YjiN (DUF445 family)